jgi:hypothetical protein
MADAIKSVLFVDYDSLYQAILAADAGAAERLASRVPAWVAAIEQGRLAPTADASVRRRVLMRRCYANPAALGDKRKHFTGNGFLVVDCPPLEGHDRSATDLHMALDTIDALGHPTAYDEFILLSADRDLSPVLIRLRAHNRQSVIFARPGTPDSYKAIADATVDEEPFVAVLNATDEAKAPDQAAARPAQPAAAPAAAAPAADRTEIEALARKVHAATNVPLFSPKSYLELFRVLAGEIAENGYHFQATAENVAAKLTASGRNATRRQIVFIVKGLALKGHVFSNTDTPDRLAEVFREQVLYLCRNAGLELSPREVAIMPSWIIGRVGSTVAAVAAEIEADVAEPEPVPPKPAPVLPKPESRLPPMPAIDAKANKKKPVKPAPLAKTEASIATPPRPVMAVPPKPSDAAKPGAPQGKSSVFPRPLSPAAGKASPVTSRPATPLPAGTSAKPAAPSSTTPSNPPRPVIIAPKPLTPKTVADKPAEKAPPTPPAAEKPAEEVQADKPATDRPAATVRDKSPATGDKTAVESTILAAIAQAVDVLVEDSSAARQMERGSERGAGEEQPTAPSADEVPPPDSDDIGDEIQRIIASYNRDRQQSD